MTTPCTEPIVAEHAFRPRRTEAEVAERAQPVLRGDRERGNHERLSAFARDRSPGARHRQPRRVDRLLDRHAVVDQVQRNVQYGIDDGRAAWRTVGRDRLAVLEQDARRHARAWPLVRSDVVGARVAGCRVVALARS